MRAVHFVCICLMFLSSVLPAQNNGVPFINQPLVPVSVAPGSSDFTLTVNGANFVSESVVEWNGTALPTTYITRAQLTAVVPASDVAKPQSASVTVVNPAPGGGISNVSVVQVATPVLSLVLNTVNEPPPFLGNFPPVQTADFNGDGKLDFAVTDYYSGPDSVLIMLGNGDGTFQTGKSYPVMAGDTDQGQYNLVVGDFNGDGKLDLIAGLTVLFGNGDGTFRVGPTLPAAVGQLVAGDFNGDGKLDLIGNIAGPQGLAGWVMLGNGDGTFRLLTAFPLGFGGSARVADLLTADFNGDGVLDLGVLTQVNTTEELTIFIGNGDGTFQTPVNSCSAQINAGFLAPSFLAADFNGDNKQDFAYSFSNQALAGAAVAFEDGSGSCPDQFIPPAPPTPPERVFAGDYNDDGKLDLAVAAASGYGGQIGYVFLGAGNETLGSPEAFGPKQAELLAAGDFNGDGRPDFIGTSADSLVVMLQSVNPVPQPVPSSLDFSTPLLVGTTSSPQTITFSNTGNAALSLSSIAITGTDAGDFAQTNNCPHSLAPAASCQVKVRFSPQGGGTRSASVQLTDNASGSPQSVALTGAVQDFGLSVTSQTSLTVTPGQAANYSLSVFPQNGFAQTLSMSCSGQPAQSTCSVKPSSVSLKSGPQDVNLVVVTTGSAAGFTQPFGGPPGNHWLAWWTALSWALALAWLLGIRRVQRTWRPQWPYGVTLLCLLSAVATIPACGGGGSGSSSTPTGTYTPTVTATYTNGSVQLSHSVNVTLTVQ